MNILDRLGASSSVSISMAGVQTPQRSGGVHSLKQGQNATLIAYINNPLNRQVSVTVQYVVGGQQVTESPFFIPANTTDFKASVDVSWNTLSQYGTGNKQVEVRFPSYSPHGQQTTQAGTLDIVASSGGSGSIPSGGTLNLYTLSLDKTSVSQGGSVAFDAKITNTSNAPKGVRVEFYYAGQKVDTAVGNVTANTQRFRVTDTITYSTLSGFGNGSNATKAVLLSGGSWPKQSVSGPSLTVSTTTSSSGRMVNPNELTAKVQQPLNPTPGGKAVVNYTNRNPFAVSATLTLTANGTQFDSKRLTIPANAQNRSYQFTLPNKTGSVDFCASFKNPQPA